MRNVSAFFVKVLGKLQCSLMRRALRRAFRKTGPPFCQEMHEALRAGHLTASSEELEILRREFPSKDFEGHHVKCSECWEYYMSLKRKHCGG